MTSLPALEKLRNQWLQDIPDFDSDDWDDIWDFPYSSLVSLMDRLIQFKMVHHAYFTPHSLHKMNPDSPLGAGVVGGLDLPGYCWVLERGIDIHNPGHHYTTKTFYVNLHAGLDRTDPHSGGAYSSYITSFYAHKVISLSWRKPTPPSLSLWKQLVNNGLHLYKVSMSIEAALKNRTRSGPGGWQNPPQLPMHPKVNFVFKILLT